MTDQEDKPRPPLETIPVDLSMTENTEETVMRRIPAELLAEARRSDPDDDQPLALTPKAEPLEPETEGVEVARPEAPKPGPPSRPTPSVPPMALARRRHPTPPAEAAMKTDPDKTDPSRARREAARGEATRERSSGGWTVLVLALIMGGGVGAWLWLQPDRQPLRGQPARGAMGLATPAPSPPPSPSPSIAPAAPTGDVSASPLDAGALPAAAATVGVDGLDAAAPTLPAAPPRRAPRRRGTEDPY